MLHCSLYSNDNIRNLNAFPKLQEFHVYDNICALSNETFAIMTLGYTDSKIHVKRDKVHR